MPKVPLYNQGGASPVELAAGRLGARPNEAALAAPARALTQLGETIGRTGRSVSEGEMRVQQSKLRFEEEKARIDFNFQKAEQDQADRIYLKTLDRNTRETLIPKLLEDTSPNATAAKNKFSAEGVKILDNIRGQQLRPSLEAAALQTAENAILSVSLQAQEKGFKTQLKAANDSDNESLEIAKNQLSQFPQGSPEHDLAKKTAADIFQSATNENRLGSLKFNPRTFDNEVFIASTNLSISKAEQENDLAALDQILVDVKENKGLGVSKQTEAASVVRATKKRVQTSIFEGTRETLMEASLSSSEASQISDLLDAGEDVVFERATGSEINLPINDMTVSARKTLQADLERLSKDAQQGVRDDLSADISDAFGTGDSAGAVAKITSLAADPSVENEDLEAAILATANELLAESQAAFDEGNFDTADLHANAAQKLVGSAFGDIGELRQRTGAVGKQANTIFSSASGIKAKGVDERGEVAEVDIAVSQIEAGIFDVVGTETKPDVQKKALINALSGKTPAQQFKVLANNNLTFGPLKGSLIGAATEGLSATYNEETITKALETYRLAKPFGDAVVNNHTDETTRAFFESIIALQNFGTETSDAIRQVNLSSQTEIDVNARYSTVKAAVDGIQDKSVTTIFGFNFSGQRVENRVYLQENIERVSKIYIGLGTLSAEDAVEKAAADVLSTHLNLRGILTPKSPSFPKEIEKMVDLAAEDFIKQNPTFDLDEISLFPAPGRVDEYFVLQNGVVATGAEVNVYTLEDLQALLEQEKDADDAELIEDFMKARGLTEPQQIRDEIQELNREASELTGINLSRIRQEQGDEAAASAIAERVSKLSRAKQLQDKLNEMQE
jgi:hypothetical protein|tara:strand:+ start:3066 stop:5615 length:2550 start_codon:yes stop_codon:yes gene_type:complete